MFHYPALHIYNEQQLISLFNVICAPEKNNLALLHCVRGQTSMFLTLPFVQFRAKNTKIGAKTSKFHFHRHNLHFLLRWVPFFCSELKCFYFMLSKSKCSQLIPLDLVLLFGTISLGAQVNQNVCFLRQNCMSCNWWNGSFRR